RVSPLAFGGNVFGWTADETTSFALLDAFVEAGFNFIDTADAYSRFVPGNVGGESETILGRWFAARGPAMRARVVLATKVGLEMGPGDIGLSAQYIRRAVDRSLQRLQTDYIDLYQAHRDDPSVPLEETAAAFDALVKAGKVRVLGASNFSADRLAAALEVSAKLGLARYESLQPHYNLVVRSEFESQLAALCAREQIGVIPYFALASGFLTGKYRSAEDVGKSVRGARMAALLDARGLRILAALDAIAANHETTQACVAIAWLLARGVTAPIASATSVAQLQQILPGATLSLSQEEVAALNAASATPA
ncbi:MAG: aldo/keto reductase, partial [Gammaproteobacteria bacterium]|nr:aldo/keto reductase [Gammaproteobacteria bacterium]